MLHYVYIGIGSNVQAVHNLSVAVEQIERIANVQARAPIYQSAATGAVPDSPDYLNTALLITTSLPMDELKTVLRRIEDQSGRIRYDAAGRKSALVSLDCDILMICQPADQVCFVDEDVPLLAHALVPLADLSPELCLPGFSVKLRDLAGPLRASLSKLK